MQYYRVLFPAIFYFITYFDLKPLLNVALVDLLAVEGGDAFGCSPYCRWVFGSKIA